MKIKLNKLILFRIFIVLIFIYFIMTYTIVNRETINQQIDLITQGGSFFAKTATYRILHLNKTHVGFDKDTYEIELLTFNDINDIREEVDLNRLQWDPMLAELARKHALDMAENNYFNHTNLKGLEPVDRANILGIKTTLETKTHIYTGVGENLGFMPKGIVKDIGILITTDDISSAMVYEWMLSEPHKKNILQKDYRYTGIGVAYDGKGNYYIAQEFQ